MIEYTKLKREGYIMALIICPECGKEISNKAKYCIHCGYPLDELKEETSNIINDKNNLYSVKLINYGSQKVKVIAVVREITGLRLPEAKAVVDNLSFIKTGICLEEANSIKNQLEELGAVLSIVICDTNKIISISPKTNAVPIPTCPTCGSTDISKISTTSKAVSVGLFGIFSSKIRKQFHCNSCKYEW